ncbi:MAG TPA: hypothetical protein VFZ75_07330 [Actinomycetota bacterium]|nr:hypothetical protein [Actinomycetota bacterium]
MRALRTLALALALVLVPASAAVAQVSVDPSVSPELNTGGWIRGMAILLTLLGLVIILLVVAAYVRFAPRFSSDETTLKVVRADRVRPGEELPRRTVDIKAAAPVVVAPPPLPQPVGVAAAPAPPSAAGPASPAPAAAPASPAPAEAPAQAGPGAEAPSTDAPQAAPASEGAPAEADAATETREQATPAASEAAPAPAPAPAERVEVSLDQEVFDQTLKELLDKGTDKRVAEGQARRAAMIAARKKAAGEG